MKNQMNTNLVIRSSLALALALAIWSPVQARSAEPAEGKNMTEAKMMERCQEMKEQKQKMMEDMKAQDAHQEEPRAGEQEDGPDGRCNHAHGGAADHHGCAKGKDGGGDDEAHDAAHADGQGIHVAVPDDEGDEGYGRKIGGCSNRTERICARYRESRHQE